MEKKFFEDHAVIRRAGVVAPYRGAERHWHREERSDVAISTGKIATSLRSSQ